jgi:signal transduction histidine kinase
MRDFAVWIKVQLGDAGRINALRRGNGVLGAVLGNIIVKRASHGALIARNGIDRCIDDDGAQLLDSELGSDRAPFAEDGILIVDLETRRVVEAHPSAEQNAGPALNGAAARNGRPVVRARIIGSVVRSITPQDRPSREAELRVEELASASRRKDEFLAMVSHELRSPLSAIHQAVRLLGRHTGETPSPQQRMQSLIERQLRRMTRLVDDLIDVSRITHGRLQLQRERIDLRVILRNAIETLESDISERNHRLATELPDAPVWLQADPGRLEQVFVNLLANASRYTDAGGELTMWVHTKDGQAVVRIRDSGIGIAPQALPHIFDLFKQGNEADPRSKAGLGIGLAVVRNLVELHGGSVTAASAGSGQGSEFTVRLPTEEPT